MENETLNDRRKRNLAIAKDPSFLSDKELCQEIKNRVPEGYKWCSEQLTGSRREALRNVLQVHAECQEKSYVRLYDEYEVRQQEDINREVRCADEFMVWLSEKKPQWKTTSLVVKHDKARDEIVKRLTQKGYQVLISKNETLAELAKRLEEQGFHDIHHFASDGYIYVKRQ